MTADQSALADLVPTPRPVRHNDPSFGKLVSHDRHRRLLARLAGCGRLRDQELSSALTKDRQARREPRAPDDGDDPARRHRQRSPDPVGEAAREKGPEHRKPEGELVDPQAAHEDARAEPVTFQAKHFTRVCRPDQASVKARFRSPCISPG